MVKEMVVLGIPSPNLAFIDYWLLFSPNTRRFLPVFRETACFWVNLGSQIFRNIRPWFILLPFTKKNRIKSDLFYQDVFLVKDFKCVISVGSPMGYVDKKLNVCH